MLNPRLQPGVRNPPTTVPCKGTTIRQRSAYMPMTWSFLFRKSFTKKKILGNSSTKIFVPVCVVRGKKIPFGQG
jgi:hypothetical protein